MYTILYTQRCRDFASKLAEKLGDSIIISIDDVLKDPTKLGSYDKLGLIFNTEGKIVPADIEDLILDVFAHHPSRRVVEYMFSICITDGRSDFGLKVVEKLCQKAGHPTSLNLAFPSRTRNDIDIERAVYLIKERHYIGACSNFFTSLYMTKYGVLTGKLRKGKKEIIEPHIDVFERTRRILRWAIAIPIMIIAIILPIFLIPFAPNLARLGMYLNVIHYSFLLFVTYIVTKYILKFPFRRLFTQNHGFYWKNTLIGFAAMSVVYLATDFLWMAINPNSFSLTVGDVTWRTVLPTFTTVILQTFIEILMCISYVAFFRKDTMPTKNREQIVCCIASSILFILFHGRNPYTIILLIITGFAMAGLTFRTNGTEAAIGIWFAYKLITALLFTYKGAPLASKAVFTQSDKIGPMMIVQYIVCLAASLFMVLKFGHKIRQKQKTA